MKFRKGDIICREDRAYPAGALVCDGYDEAGRVLAHPLGGGFQLTVPAGEDTRFRLVDEGERNRALWRPAKFRLADSEEAFDGWTDGHFWNGWEKPAFELAEAQRLVGTMGIEGARFDAEQDAFITLNQDGEEEVWPGQTVFISDGTGVKVYPIGAGAWTWEEA